jgi:hypothetical protein
MRHTTHTKAQMQMGETIAVLVVFFFLLVIGLVFYVNIASTKAEESRYKNTELESVNVMKRALSLPELQCSHNNIVDEACVDRYKIIAARDAMLNSDVKASYFDLFGTSTISIIQIYPAPTTAAENTVLLYDYRLIEFSSRLNTSTPISIYNPLTKSYAFGIMETVTYGK